MNEKQAKLLRYFVKASNDKALAESTKKNWQFMTPRQKGKLTTWMKKVIVTMIAIRDQKKKTRLVNNLDVLKGLES